MATASNSDNANYNLKANKKYYNFLNDYSIQYLKSIEDDDSKIEFFREKILLSLTCTHTNNKFVCLFGQCIKKCSSFKTKQSYTRHLITQHKNELPGGGTFLTQSAQYYSPQECTVCGNVFNRKDHFNLHLKNSSKCKKQYIENEQEKENPTNSLKKENCSKISSFFKVKELKKNLEENQFDNSSNSSSNSSNNDNKSETIDLSALKLSSSNSEQSSSDDNSDLIFNLEDTCDKERLNHSVERPKSNTFKRELSSYSIAALSNDDKKIKVDSEITNKTIDDLNSDDDDLVFLKESGFLAYLDKNNI